MFTGVFVYVDDIVLADNDSDACQKLKAYLHTCFSIKDLGPLKYFLGIEFARGPTGLFMCERKYPLEVINERGLLGAKPTEFRKEENHKLALAIERLLNAPTKYQRLIGCLIYLTIIRPDLTYTVHILSQFKQAP